MIGFVFRKILKSLAGLLGLMKKEDVGKIGTLFFGTMIFGVMLFDSIGFYLSLFITVGYVLTKASGSSDQ
mgnify:FL=1|jgi:hypothetical protein